MFRLKIALFSLSTLLFVGCGTEQLVDFAANYAAEKLKEDGENPDTVVSETEDIANMLLRNNEIRQEVFSGSPIYWSDALALSAQSHADTIAATGKLEHSQSGYGENLYVSFSSASYEDAVNSWYEEKVYYDYAGNSCTAGQECAHYTQLIWEESTEVGCGKASNEAQTATAVVCQYNPPGNQAGEQPY